MLTWKGWNIVVAGLSATYFVAAAGLSAGLLFAHTLGPIFSSAQASYFHYALWMIPAAVVWQYWRANGSPFHQLHSALLTGGFLCLALVAAAVLAILIFPVYPAAGPHELIANATLLPAVLGGGWYLTRELSGSLRRKAITVALGWGLPAAGLISCNYVLYAEPLRNIFPVTTQDLHYDSYYEMQDIFQYAAKGRISSEEAARIVQELKLLPHPGSIPTPNIGHAALGWWNPPSHPSHWRAFEKPDKPAAEWEGCTTIALYANGYFYLAMDCSFL